MEGNTKSASLVLPYERWHTTTYIGVGSHFFYENYNTNYWTLYNPGCSSNHNRAKDEIRVTVNLQVVDNKVDSLLLINAISHHFSSLTYMDTLTIKVTGQTIVEGDVKFEIKTWDGLVIYSEVFPATHLIGYELDNNASEIEKIDRIKNRINKFFDSVNFRQPAITSDQPYEADFSNEEIWADIKSDSTAVSFYYLLGEEGNNLIAYSKKMRKTVTIFSCC